MTEARYARVYWSIFDDPRFETIIDNERHLGTWLKLLLVADMAWPVPAYLPPVPRASLKALAAAGLIELRSGSRYIVHGLDSERERRSASASVGASARWSGRNANALQSESDGNAETMPSRAEQSKAEQNRERAESPAPNDGKDDPVVALGDRTGTFPRGRLLSWTNDLGKRHGESRTAALIRSTAMDPGEAVNTYLERIGQGLARQDHEAERAEVEAERRRLAEKRARPTPLHHAPSDQTKEEQDAELRAYFAREGTPA